MFLPSQCTCSPLLVPYDGRFRVLEAGHKFFLVEMGTGQDRVSCRLKPGHVHEDRVVSAHPARHGHLANPVLAIDHVPLESCLLEVVAHKLEWQGGPVAVYICLPFVCACPFLCVLVWRCIVTF